MKRRAFLAASLVLPLGARAQAQRRTIGLLWNDSVQPSPHVPVLLGTLHRLGWTAGRNLEVKDHVALEGYRPMAESAATLVTQGCDVIVTFGATAATIAARATKDIPIAMLIGSDPVQLGLAQSLARPGGNVTGVWNLSQGLIGKRLELLRELAPGIKEAGVLVAGGSAQQGRDLAMDETKAAAVRLRMTLHFANVGSPEEIEPAVASLAKIGARAVYVGQGTFLAAHSARIVQAIAARRLIAVYSSDRFAEAGGLVSYAPSVNAAFARLASYVDLILRGAKPAGMPIEQQSEVELVVNLKTAKAQGIRIPQSILQRADRAIE